MEFVQHGDARVAGADAARNGAGAGTGDATNQPALSACAAVVFDGPCVELPQMLDARERRAALQRQLLADADEGESLLSFTLSIPGPHKTSAVLERVFNELASQVDTALADVPVHDRMRAGGATGPEFLMVCGCAPRDLKRLMVAIEETHPLGRLADLDVLGRTGDTLYSVSRTELGLPPRRCLICGGEAKACARSRAHTVQAMQERIAEIIQQGGYI